MLHQHAFLFFYQMLVPKYAKTTKIVKNVV